MHYAYLRLQKFHLLLLVHTCIYYKELLPRIYHDYFHCNQNAYFPMILETKLIVTYLALTVPLDKNVLNIKEHCYGINSQLILKVSHLLIGLS